MNFFVCNCLCKSIRLCSQCLFALMLIDKFVVIFGYWILQHSIQLTNIGGSGGICIVYLVSTELFATCDDFSNSPDITLLDIFLWGYVNRDQGSYCKCHIGHRTWREIMYRVMQELFLKLDKDFVDTCIILIVTGLQPIAVFFN